MKTFLTCIAACGILMLSPKPAQAVILINFLESGSDVVANVSGSVIIDFSSSGTDMQSGRVDASAPAFFIGGPGDTEVERYPVALSGPASFGTGSNVASSFGSGDVVGMGSDLYYMWVPLTFVSGAPLSGTATWTGQTFASLGLTPGSYAYTFASGESVVLDIGAAVPEPSTALPLLGLILGLAWVRRKRGNTVYSI